MITRAFWADTRGNLVLLFALAFTVSIGVAAIAVDSASLYYERRALQAGVDLAAITAVGNPARAQELAQLVLVDAGLLAPGSTQGLSVVAGRYVPDIARPVSDRFLPGGTPINAVQVSLTRQGALHFARPFSEPQKLAATGLAAFTPEVSLSLGTRLASLNGGLANSVLTSLLGTSVSLSVMDYNALASAQVDALAFAGALGEKLDVTAGSYADVLTMSARAGVVAAALAEVTTGLAHNALNAISRGGQGAQVPLAKLLSLGILGSRQRSASPLTGIDLSALDVLMASARLADGQRQVGLNLGANVPNLAALRLDLAIGEPAQGAGWFRMGENGIVLRTSQLRMRLAAELLGGPVLLGAGVKLPILLEAAHAEARVVSISCPSAQQPNGSASVAVRPGLLKLTLGSVTDSALRNFGQPLTPTRAQLIDVLLLKVSGAAQVEIAQPAALELSFSSSEIGARTIKTARTRSMVGSLMGSLLSTLDLHVEVLGLGLSSPALIRSTVQALITPLGPTLDLTIAGVFSALGLGVGEADVLVYGVRCSAPSLVR